MANRAGSTRELEFIATLGQGGFGSVYLAWLHGERGWKRQVAVKVLNDKAAETPELHARQWDEARLLGLLAHESIVQVVDVAEIAGRPAALMEYVEGVDLAQVVRAEAEERRFVPQRAVAQMVAIAAGALDAAYNGRNPATGQPLRVIHRDIKPANLLITAGGGLKVLDFGIARADIQREAVTRSVSFGTPRYMAPEQWTGAEIGPGTDVYALGVSFYELLAGRPYDRPPLTEGAYEERLGELLGELPGAVQPLLTAMLALDPRHRPTAAEVASRAEQLHLDGETLAQLARRVVPALLARRRAVAFDGALPARVELEGALASPTPPGLLDAPPTPSLAVPPSEPAQRRPGMFAVAATGSLGLLVLLGWRLLAGFGGSAPAAGEGAPASAPATAAVDPSATGELGTAPVATVPSGAAESAAASGAAPAPGGSAGAAPAAGDAGATGPLGGSTIAGPTSVGGALDVGARAAGATGRMAGTGGAGATPGGAPATDAATTAAAGTDARPTSTTLASSSAATPPDAGGPAGTPTWPLKVVSEPIGATILVDGKAMGRTPRLLDLPEGDHTIVIDFGSGTSPPKQVQLTHASGLKFNLDQQVWQNMVIR